MPDGPKPTPLAAMHRDKGARITDFCGWSMPLHYPEGIVSEHLGCRRAAGLFDVSHMGQFVLRGPAAAQALERMGPMSAAGLKPGRQAYSVLTLESGGLLDDCMVAHLPDGGYWMVVNAARADLDWQVLEQAAAGLELEILRLQGEDARALLALQGPDAARIVAGLAPQLEGTFLNDVRQVELLGEACWVARSGYTGEDGFEISAPAAAAEELAAALLGLGEVHLCGLGARDTLRLEAGLCLYGQDLDEQTSPVEAGLAWTIAKARRAGGEREGGFPGAAEVLRQLELGPPRCRTGLVGESRQPVRPGAQVWRGEEEVGDAASALGEITSGTFSPSLQRPIAMASLRGSPLEPGTGVFTRVRDRVLQLRVAGLPFVPARQKRRANT